MTSATQPDHYEVLQINPSAEPETVHRVYRMLAQRFHPDNQETGNADRFRQLTAAYEVISAPERRAQYDIVYASMAQQRWRLIDAGTSPETDFEAERVTRLTVLEVLYTARRVQPVSPGASPLELEALTGRPREHLEFTIWYLSQKRLVVRSDNSILTITADGVDHLENSYQSTVQRRRLQPHT